MAGPLSDEKLLALRRATRKFDYHPNLDDVRCLLATVDQLKRTVQGYQNDGSYEMGYVDGQLFVAKQLRHLAHQLGLDQPDDDETKESRS